mmetsp:Transcript_105744/g.264757  ORF Transcript_105744/g.264757 Transcript_105744/m.264757 type:complete len:137 (-) Transcript_105744:137-547(-)
MEVQTQFGRWDQALDLLQIDLNNQEISWSLTDKSSSLLYTDSSSMEFAQAPPKKNAATPGTADAIPEEEDEMEIVVEARKPGAGLPGRPQAAGSTVGMGLPGRLQAAFSCCAWAPGGTGETSRELRGQSDRHIMSL